MTQCMKCNRVSVLPFLWVIKRGLSFLCRGHWRHWRLLVFFRLLHLKDYLQMDTTSRWRRPQNEANPKIKPSSKQDPPQMKTTSKWIWPQNDGNIKMKTTSKWRWPRHEYNLKMKTSWKWSQLHNLDYLKMNAISKRRNERLNEYY